MEPQMIYEAILRSLAEKYPNDLYTPPGKGDIKALVQK
jgi:hypothetical protein